MKIEKLPWEFLVDASDEVNSVGTKVNELVDAFNEQSEKEQASEEKVKPPVPCEKCGGGRFHETDCPLNGKPQEEPKCADCGEKKSWHKEDWHEFIATDKESESKEVPGRWLGMSLDEVEELYKDAIILPRPKGMSIGVAIAEFTNWNPTKDEIYYTIPDPDFIKLWQEWRKSVEK